MLPTGGKSGNGCDGLRVVGCRRESAARNLCHPERSFTTSKAESARQAKPNLAYHSTRASFFPAT